MAIILALLVPILFIADPKTQHFLDVVDEEVKAGAVWKYVGFRALDPTARASLPLRGTAEGKPFIIYKLVEEK